MVSMNYWLCGARIETLLNASSGIVHAVAPELCIGVTAGLRLQVVNLER